MTNRDGFRGENDPAGSKSPYVHSTPSKFAPSEHRHPEGDEQRGVYIQDADFTLYQGDALEVLRGLPAESVHCVVTSPPYWGLRDYNADGQLGLEATPDLYISNMVAVFREVRRVLRVDGTCWVNMGDSYNSAEARKSYGDQSKRYEEGRDMGIKRPLIDGLKTKDLVMMPARLALALQADGWWLRSQVVWSKPNPMPESVTDRPTTSHEFVYLLAKSPRYFFDQEAVREPHAENNHGSPGERAAPGPRGDARTFGARAGLHDFKNPAGRNLRSVWEIPTQPYPEAHFATYPEELVRRCILAGSSERGCCPECGAPWERETKYGPDANRPQAKRAMEIAEREGLTEEHIEALRACGISDTGKALVTTHGAGRNDPEVQALADQARSVLKGYAREFLIRGSTETTGWQPSCKCGAGSTGPTGARSSLPCTVLDPFLGSGTTALVARKHGRRCIGVELSAEYCALAARRTQQLSLEAV